MRLSAGLGHGTGQCLGVGALRLEREARYWDGIAASASANVAGVRTFGGGAKDSGGRVGDAILYADTESGRKIRGR